MKHFVRNIEKKAFRSQISIVCVYINLRLNGDIIMYCFLTVHYLRGCRISSIGMEYKNNGNTVVFHLNSVMLFD